MNKGMDELMTGRKDEWIFIFMDERKKGLIDESKKG